MPICPKCIVGMPEWYTECPTCGGVPIDIAHDDFGEMPDPEPDERPEPEAAEPEPEELDNDEVPDGDEFIASAAMFSVLRPTTPPACAAPPGPKPVRWVHRAYRGDVEVTSKGTNGATILAIFGDGLLAADGGSNRLMRALSGSRGGRHRKILESASSSEDAHARIPGSRLYPLAEIEGVYVERSRGRALSVTIRTSGDANPQFRVTSNHYPRLIELLSPVLRAKLRDAARPKKAAKAG